MILGMRRKLAKMDWGSFTPEFYRADDKRMVHIIDHPLRTQEEVDRNIRFIIGRIQWMHMKGGHHTVFLYDDDFVMAEGAREQIRNALKNMPIS